jgi:hypothetical protein
VGKPVSIGTCGSSLGGPSGLLRYTQSSTEVFVQVKKMNSVLVKVLPILKSEVTDLGHMPGHITYKTIQFT